MKYIKLSIPSYDYFETTITLDDKYNVDQVVELIYDAEDSWLSLDEEERFDYGDFTDYLEYFLEHYDITIGWITEDAFVEVL